MQLTTFEAPLLGATCAVLADAQGRAVVVDAGGGVGDRVRALVREAGWTPVAVLATHGHVDHTWDAGSLGADWDVPVHLHAADAYRLADPFGTLGPLGAQLATMAGLPAPVTPPRVVEHDSPRWSTDVWELADGLSVVALHLPGHTEGSTAFLVEVAGTATLFTGDVLFTGTVGRTDLPGGDQTLMTASLAHLAGLDPGLTIVPGHGPRSTVGAELRLNPYLRTAR